MKTNILWSGIEYHSLEHCVVDIHQDCVTVRSTILGFYDEKMYRVDYLIKLNTAWQFLYCHLESDVDAQYKKIEISNDDGRWSLNGKYCAAWDGCTDIDIPLTPFTNTLPINRLSLDVGQQMEVEIVYIDVLEDSCTKVKQKYSKISSECYLYQNVPNDFEAEIKIDETGFVVDYPKLFLRKARLDSN